MGVLMKTDMICGLIAMVGWAVYSHGDNFTPTLSAAGGYAAVATPDAPNPDIGNICPDCNGKGWVGDGTHRYKCEPCDGTGKRTTEGATSGVTHVAAAPPMAAPHVEESMSPPEAKAEGHEAPFSSAAMPPKPTDEELAELDPDNLSNEVICGLMFMFQDEISQFCDTHDVSDCRTIGDFVRAWLMSKQPAGASHPEAPSMQTPPAIAVTYDAACQEAVRTRELLVIIYDTEETRRKSLAYLESNPAADKYVWLLTPNTATVNGVPVLEFFGAGDRTRCAVRHNVATQESKLILKPEDLEN